MEGCEQPKRQIPAFNAMTIRTRRQTNVSKQHYWMALMLVRPNSGCWRGLNSSVHEAMNNISNVKVHLKTRS